MQLFDRNHVVGVFRGFSHGGMEFHADLVLPYREDFQSVPMHGTFVLVQLEHEREAVFGRTRRWPAKGGWSAQLARTMRFGRSETPGQRDHASFKRDVVLDRRAVRWGTVQSWLSKGAPPAPIAENSFQWAYGVVTEAMDTILGRGNWTTERRPEHSNPAVTKSWIIPSQGAPVSASSDEPTAPALEEEEPPF